MATGLAGDQALLAKISKRAVDATQPDPARDLWIWDIGLKGFGMRVRPTGHRVYVVEYRPGAGGRSAPKRRVTIGRHGSPWTPESARREAERILGLVASGIDPASNKAALRGSPTVAEFGARYMEEHVERKRKARTAEHYRALADRFLFPALGRKKVSEITRQDVARLHNSMRETPYQANRCLALASALFAYAERVGERPAASNPARGIERFGEETRERLLSPFELGCIGEALRRAEASAFLEAVAQGGRIYVCAILPDAGPTPGKVLELPRDRDEAEAWLERHSRTQNLYFVLDEPAADLPSGKRGALAKTEVTRIRGVVVDLDPTVARPRERLLERAGVEIRHVLHSPTFAVDTGNGVQMGYVFP